MPCKTGVIVTAAWTQRGWSPNDHLIDDSRLDEIIGRHFASVRAAMRAAEKRADERGYAAIEYLVCATGQTWQRGAEPALPGRAPMAVRTG